MPVYPYYEPSTQPYYSHAEYPVLGQDDNSEATGYDPASMVYPTPTPSPETSVHIHAPVPVSAYSALLPSIDESARSPTPQPHPLSVRAIRAALPNSGTAQIPARDDTKPSIPIVCYASVPQQTFPTPCELLSELTAHDRACAEISPPHRPQPAPSHGNRHLRGEVLAADQCVASLSQPDAKGMKAVRRTRANPAKKPETQRKAHFRAIAENIGFKPTDPYVTQYRLRR